MENGSTSGIDLKGPYLHRPEDEMDKEKKEEEEETVTVDALLDKVGGCGRFQIMLEFVICLITFALGFHALLMYFVGHSPNWKCAVDANNNTIKECDIQGIVDSSNITLFNSRCDMDRGSWEYVTNKEYSFITEFDLVCNASFHGTLANSAFYIGWGIGALPLGILSDFSGRKPVFFASFLTVMVCTIAMAFATSFAQFFSLRIITGIGQSGFSLTSYILASENVGAKFRAATGNILFVIVVIAFLVLDLQAYLIHKWRTLVLLCSAPYAALIFFYFYVPESLRWLTAKKELDQAEKVLQRMAKINKKPMYHFGSLLPKLATKQGGAKGSLIDILRHRVLLVRSLNQGLSWFVCGMTYYGISLASADLTGSLYRDFALTSIVEIPSIFIVISGVERFGRKRVIPISLSLSGILCAAVAFVPEKSTNTALPFLRVTFGMLGKLFNTVAFNGFYVWSTELYPTVIRTQGLSFVFFMARIGASSAPFIANGLKLIHPAIPFILMGICSLVSGLLSGLLPETKGRPMLESVEDAIKDGSLLSPASETILLTPLNDTKETGNDSDEEDTYDEKATLL